MADPVAAQLLNWQPRQQQMRGAEIDMQSAQQAMALRAIQSQMQQAQERDRAAALQRMLTARGGAGQALYGLFGGGAQPGIPQPPAGAAPGGMQPPMQPAPPPGTLSPGGGNPAAAGGMPPPQAVPMPQGPSGQPTVPMPNAQGGAPTVAMPQAQVPQPFRPMPTAAPGAPPGGIPAPPATAPTADAPVERMFDLKAIIGNLKQSGVPPNQVMDMLDTLQPTMNAQNKVELDAYKAETAAQAAAIRAYTAEISAYKAQRDLDLREEAERRRREQGDRRLGQGDRALDIKAQAAKDKAARAAAGEAVAFDAQDVQYWAEVMREGGDLPPRLAYTPGGKKLVADVMRAVSRSGTSPTDMLSNKAEFMGEKAAQRTAGTRGAQLAIVAHEMDKFIPIAQKAADAVPRTNFVPLNRLIQLGENQWSPEQAAFVTANRSLINTFAMLSTRGVSTVHSMQEAEKMLNTAATPAQYRAVVDQLGQEAKAAIDAVKEVKGTIRREASARAGTSPAGRAPAPQAHIDYLMANKGDPKVVSDFSAKYGYLPAGVR